MRLKFGGVALLLLTAACSVHIGSDGGGGGRTAHPAPPPPRPAPPPAPPPQQANNNQHPAPPPPPPNNGGKLGEAALHPASPHIGADSHPVNVSKMQEIRNRQPKACGIYEVAPGVWTRIDCQMYTQANKATLSLSGRKAKLVVGRKTLWKPMHIVGPAVKADIQKKRLAVGKMHIDKPKNDSAAATGSDNDPPGIIVADSWPAAADHRNESGGLEGPVKSQGAVGSCTAFALSSVVDNAAIRAGKAKPNDGSSATSPNHVWSGYGIPNMGAAADSNISRPLATMAVWEQNNPEACQLANPTDSYHEDCGDAYGVQPGTWRNNKSLVGKYDGANSKGQYKIAFVEKMATRPPNMNEVVSALAAGQDLFVAFLIDGSKFTNSAMKNGVIPDWSDYSGGHALNLAGYRDTPSGRQFLLHNSWGTSWGDNGYAWVSEAMVQKWMYFAYKVKISGGVKEPTDDDCAPDELVDATTNQCAVICPDDSRPDNGCGKK